MIANHNGEFVFASGCTNISGSGVVFYMIPCHEGRRVSQRTVPEDNIMPQLKFICNRLVCFGNNHGIITCLMA